MTMIGLIGGMSWESSAEYYRLINQGVRDRRGPTSSARCLLWSFDFAEIERLHHAGDWPALSERMVDAARRLVAAGAQAIILGCTEIMLLVRAEDSAVPLFDTTALHARAAIDCALG